MFIRKLLYRHSLHKQNRQAVAFPNWAKCNHILLLLDGNTLQYAEDMVSELHKDEKDVTIVGYIPHIKHEEQTNAPYHIVTKKDFTLLGKPKKPLLQLLTKHYDLLLDLTHRQDLHTLWMSALTTADFKAGQTTQAPFYATEQRLDFMIQLPPSSPVDYLFHQILHYLKQIKPQL